MLLLPAWLSGAEAAMAVVPAQSLRVSEIRDPATLFERYNTEEIRAIERKVRGEIEQKKEELRQMVGERYRDLIEAADTIGEMRQCSESVVNSIQDMYRYCHKLKQGKSPVPASNKQEYLRATQLYLLCCHLNSLLGLEGGGASHYSPVLARFPILVRQVAAAGHFRATILLDSKSLLRGRAVSDQAITEALVSTMLLEDSSPRQALADFLLARKASIQQLLNQPQHGAGIKAQVCSLVELLVTTLYQAYAVFYTPPEGRPSDPGLSCGLLLSTLESVTSTTSAGKGQKVLQEEVSAGTWFKYLPSSVLDFQPALRTLAQPIQGEHLRDTLQQWIDTCKEDVRGGVSSLLVYVKSLKGLAAIRDAVWDLLSSESISQHWGTVCQRLLERPLPLWDDFLQNLFLQRLQALTREGTENVSSGSKQLLTSTLRELQGQSSRAALFESDVASFLWAESSGDLASDAAWVGVSHRSPHHRSGLAMKTQALTPCVQTFCTALDAKLKAQLDDLCHYLPSEKGSGKEAPELRAAVRVSAGTPAFDRFTDAGVVEDTLREHCLACVRDILSCVRAELGIARGDAQGPHPLPPAQLSSVLFMARLCQSIAELCPNLKQCILGKQGGATDPMGRGTPRQGRKLGKSVTKVAEVSPAQAQWAGLKEELLSCSMEAYCIWSSALSKELVRSFTATLHTASAGSILATATNWEELEIQEEAESGSSVTSKIRLPVQPSWYVQSLLFHLCLEVNRVGGHALPKLLFDLRYLSATLSPRPEEAKSSRPTQEPRVQQVCDLLESHIDPFDLDVFTPPLNSNLNRLSQRTSVLLGLLTGAEKQFTSRGNSVGSQEPYNILPLASSQIRFGLLPLSMSQSRKAKAATRGMDVTRPLVSWLMGRSGRERMGGNIQYCDWLSPLWAWPDTGTVLHSAAPVLSCVSLYLCTCSCSEIRGSTEAQHQDITAVTPVSTPSTDDSFRPGSLFRQLTNQEEDSATPSLFKLGWLSGMAK
ncbi:hypothetical protein JZ751_013098 [Albula glossodonta]|uniref:Conserved oligomeric Golgi complex subunit 1 n=1 Tax=Albula glossodonta TaxID=121402 RepID=A0A8T2NWQ2_9TELE|nr:hypothetical protein JZ751_013098 [Albula glossodonta]